MIGVAWSGSESEMQEFVDRHGLGFPTVNDESGVVFARFGVPVQPAWAFVSADGSLDVHVGAYGEDELTEVLRALAAG